MKGVAFVTHRDVTVHRGRVVAYLYSMAPQSTRQRITCHDAYHDAHDRAIGDGALTSSRLLR